MPFLLTATVWGAEPHVLGSKGLRSRDQVRGWRTLLKRTRGLRLKGFDGLASLALGALGVRGSGLLSCGALEFRAWGSGDAL